MPDSSTDPLQEKVEATDIDEAGCRIGECCMQEDVVGLVLPEHVVDKVGRHGHLAVGLLQPGVTTFDHPRDNGADAKRTLHQARFGKPRVEVVSEHVGIEQ